MFKRNREEKEEKEVRPKYRRIPPGKKRERSVISVSRDLHDVLKVYALKNYPRISHIKLKLKHIAMVK